MSEAITKACELGCKDECKAKAHGCASECPALPWQPEPPQQPAPLAGEVTDEQREKVMDAIAEALGDAYDCTRVWEAWSVGTMSQDDFSVVRDDQSRLAEIADAAILALRPQAEPDWRDTEIARLKAVISTLEEQQLRAVAAGLLRPQAVPMTPDHIWANDGIMSANGIIGFKFDAVIRIVRAVEAHHGITAKAEGWEKS